MEKQTKKSGLKPKMQKAKAKLLATYYSNPAKDLKIIAITGTTGRDITAHFLHEILKQCDEKAGLIIDPKSTSSLYKQLSKIWCTGSNHVVISVAPDGLANHLFYGMPIFAAVITDDIESPIVDATHPADNEAKAILFNTKPHYSILAKDNEDYKFFAKYPAQTATFSYGRDHNADLVITRSKLYKKGTEANFAFGNKRFDVATFVTSEAAVSYMAAASLCALAVGIDMDIIVDGIANYEPGE